MIRTMHILLLLLTIVVSDGFTIIPTCDITTSVIIISNEGKSRRRRTSTRQYVSSENNQQRQQQEASENNDNGKGSDSSSMFMTSLQNRLKELKEKETKLPLVVLDSMLPRQVLEIEVNNALLIELVRDCLTRESPHIGILGVARLQSGQHVHLTKGVEVEIIKDKLEFLTLDGNKRGVKMTFKATGRRFQIEEGGVNTVGDRDDNGGGWTEAKVQILDSQQEEEDEINNLRNDDASSNDEYDRLAVARAIAKANEFTSPNMNMPNNLSLVDRWIELARERERTPGQIDTLLEELGETPLSENPTEKAFWIGALINPIPAMGVALEIRPALLTAKKVEQRVEIALNGILHSIKYMDDKSARLL